MTILVRSDGIQFIMQVYREIISAKKKSQLVQEVCLLAEQHGQYAHLFNKGKSQYEAVFSTDPGCLLGESIWNYFNEPENLIYCEALPDSAKLIIVVVSQSAIVIDKKILASSLQSELLPLMTGDLSYRIITSGNVPLRKAESFGTFRFPKTLISSFETLDEPLLPRLPALKSLQLQPLPLVLRAEHLSFSFSTSGIIIMLLTIVIGGWWLLTPNEKTSSMSRTSFDAMTSSYASYYNALSSPAPNEEIIELVHTINQIYSLPGWHATKIAYAHQQYNIDLVSDGGVMRYLLYWAKSNDYRFQLSSHGASLTFHSRLSVRPILKTVYSSDQMVAKLVDQLDQLLEHQAVTLGATHQHGAVQETNLTVHLDGVSPDLLILVSRQLRGLPVELTSVSIYIHSGLMSGTIQLSVWGK